MPRANSNPDQELVEELQAELALAHSKLDQITGITTALDDSATDEQLQSALDSIYEMAAPDDDLGMDDVEIDDEEE